MEMKIPMVAISAFVVVVVLAAVLMPVLTDASTTEDTYTNIGYYNMSEVGDNTVVMTWDHTKPTIFTVDSTDIDLNDLTAQFAWGSQVSVAFSDNWIVRYVMQGTTKLVQLYNQYGGYTNGVASTGNYDLTITITNSSMTWSDTSSGSDVTISNTTAWALDANGDYTMKKRDDSVFLLKESSIIYAGGISSVGGNTVGLYFDGTVEDGYDFTYHSTDPNVQIENVESVYTEESDHKDLIKLSKITFDMTSGGNTAAVTFSYFLVPVEITAERAVHLDSNEIALLAAIPALVIIALLIGVIAIFVRSRMD